MKKKVVIYYGFSLFSCIAVLLWILEMIKGEFPAEDTGGFCLALFCSILFFFLARRASRCGDGSGHPSKKEQERATRV